MAYYYTFNSSNTGDIPLDNEGDPCYHDWITCFSPIPDGPTYYAVKGAVKCVCEYTQDIIVGIGKSGDIYEVGTVSIPGNSEEWYTFNFSLPYNYHPYWLFFMGEHMGCGTPKIKLGELYYSGYGPLGPLCPPYQNEESCEDNDCYWYYEECHAEPPPVGGGQQPGPPGIPWCSQYDNQGDCEADGCYWYDGACHNQPKEGGFQGFQSQDVWLV